MIWVGAAVLFLKDGKVLLQHRHSEIWMGDKAHGADMLGLPGGMKRSRRGRDELPAVTAWREAVEESAPFPQLSFAQFQGAVQQAVFMEPHCFFIVDCAKLSALPEDWSGQLSRLPAKEVSTAVFPTGHTWADADQLEALLTDKSPPEGWPKLWPSLIPALSHLKYVLKRKLILYHGTTVEAATAILKEGVLKPSVHTGCTGCKRRPCTCGPMLGPGVYLALEDKASSNAGRAAGAAGAVENGLCVGAVLECEVDLGACKVAHFESLCPCGCRLLGGVDHNGRWFTMESFDSIYLRGGGRAAKRPEWCVREPQRVKPLRMKVVRWHPTRVLHSEEDWQ